MHSEHDDSGTWMFYYDGDGQPITPDVILADAHACPHLAPIMASGTYVFRPSDAGGEPAEVRPATTAMDGDRFVERLFSVTQTLCRRQRPILNYLVEALVAHRHGLPAPQLPVAC